MAEFDKAQFEQLMGEGVRLHGNGAFEAALQPSTQAYKMAPPDSPERGRAARDIGAHHDRLGHHDEALGYALEAYDIHNALVDSAPNPTRAALRERAASAMYVGISRFRMLFRDPEIPDATINIAQGLIHLRQSWNDIRSARRQASGVNCFVDQYEINMARRVSVAESLYGRRATGLAIGVRAVGLAAMSESPLLDTHTPSLGRRERFQAKRKAFLGGAAAVGVAVLASPRISRRRALATNIAKRVL